MLNINELYNQHNLVASRLKFVVDRVDTDSIKNICDIGSWHLGQSLEFMRLFPNAKLYAFEASKINFKVCSDRYSTLSEVEQNRLNLYNLALNDTNGFINFYQVLGNNPGASSKYKFIEGLNGKYFNQIWEQDNAVEVECQTLDHWKTNNLIDDIDIVWMDVQGAELDVLKGARESLKNIKCIFTEVGLKPYYDGQSLKKDIDQFLCVDNDFVEIPESFEFNGSDCEANTVYVNKKFLKG